VVVGVVLILLLDKVVAQEPLVAVLVAILEQLLLERITLAAAAVEAETKNLTEHL
jgi:hypothetical protein